MKLFCPDPWLETRNLRLTCVYVPAGDMVPIECLCYCLTKALNRNLHD